MIRVTADINGITTVQEFPDASAWDHDVHGNLDILVASEVVASFRKDIWLSVVEIKDKAEPPKTTAIGSTWGHLE